MLQERAATSLSGNMADSETNLIPADETIEERNKSSAKGKGSRKKKSDRDRKSKDKKGKRKSSGVRTKFLIESLRGEMYELQEENTRLRSIISTKLPHIADEIFAKCCRPRIEIHSVDQLAEVFPEMSVIGDGEGEDYVSHQ